MKNTRRSFIQCGTLGLTSAALKVILLPFFGKWALKTHAEMDYVGDALKAIAPAA